MIRALDTDHRLTFEEFVKHEESSDVRSEYVDGHLYEVTGASARHTLILGNITGTLWNQSHGTGCQVFSSRMLLSVPPQLAYYPDAMVTCDPTDNHERYRTRPCLLYEVVSPSTILTDRREKLTAYQSIESLQGYLMVYRDQQRVESYTRNSDGIWVYEKLTADQNVWFPCVDLTVPVHALYEDVDMSPIVPSAEESHIR